MFAEPKRGVKISFVNDRSEGGGLEPQWLMGHSPVWQTVASTHWQRPPYQRSPGMNFMIPTGTLNVITVTSSKNHVKNFPLWN
jgi:hypothetical protein